MRERGLQDRALSEIDASKAASARATNVIG